MSTTSSTCLFTVLAAAAIGCGTQDRQQLSENKYISWSESSIRASTIADVRKDTLKICFKGSTSRENLNRATKWSTRSVLTWLRVLKSVDNKVTGSITYTCQDPDLTWNLRTGSGTSNASPSRINIYMTRPYGTWTHELGHALTGLGDTYSGRTAGNCRSGQPSSLMCWGAYGPRKNPDQFSTLWIDDIYGAIANYKKLFGDELTAPSWGQDFDHLSPLDMENPWPGFDGEIISTKDNEMIIDDSLHEEVNPDSAAADL